MKIKKIIVSLLALAMLSASIAGCGGKKEEADGEVVLKWVMAGPGRQKDSEEVWAAVNEKLKEKLPNVTIEFDVISGSEYKQNVMLMQTGKKKLDIVNTYQLDYVNEVENGSFIELSDLLDEYGKGTKEVLPEWLFDYMKVDDGIYAIPAYQAMANERAFITQKEYADKWLDIEGLKAELYSNEYFTEKSAQIIEDYLQKLAENDKIFYGAHHYNEVVTKGYELIFGNFHADINTHEVIYKFEIPTVKEQYKRHAKWYQNGWIRKDAQSCTDEEEKKGAAEGYVLYDNGYNKWLAASMSKNGTEFITIPFNDKYFIPSGNAAGGNAITSSCEYPEIAMQVLNLFNTDKELYNTLVYGIEGKHYTKISDNKIETPYGVQGTMNDDYGIYKWIVGNTQLAYLTQDEPEDKLDYEFNTVNNSEWRSELIGFVANKEEIADSIAQLDAIKGEYMKTLATGALGDGWEAYYDEWMEKANAAGLQEVKAEIQRQVDEFLASK